MGVSEVPKAQSRSIKVNHGPYTEQGINKISIRSGTQIFNQAKLKPNATLFLSLIQN